MKEKLFLVDGSAFAYRAFYAIRGLNDSSGRPVNAVYGFARMLSKLLREHVPDYIAVIFDAPGPTFRHELYPEYKANREKTPEDLVAQMPLLDELVEAFGLPLLRVEGIEADDVMGVLAKKSQAAEMETVIVTGDKDMLQLVSGSVRVYDPGKAEDKAWSGVDEVMERFGVGPEHVVDALALIGDSADNVPGVTKIGPVAAKKLLGQYHSLEGIYDHIEDLKGKQRENLENDKEQAFLSRELVTIKIDYPLDTTLDDLKRPPLDSARLVEFFGKLDFRSLAEEYGAELTRTDALTADYQVVDTEEGLREIVETLRNSGRFALDTETTSVNPMRAELVGISLCCSAGKAWYVPVRHCAPQNDPGLTDIELAALPPERAPSQIPFESTSSILAPLLFDPEIKKVGHNIKYDMIVLSNAGMEVRGAGLDTMVASYLTDPELLRHNLDEVSLYYLKHKKIPISDLIGKGSKQITFDRVPIETACIYACEDADMTWRLGERLREVLRERNVEDLFYEVELPLIGVLVRMEQAGIAIDKGLFAELSEEVSGRLKILEVEIFELAGGPFLLSSPKQLQQVLFEKLGLKPVRKTKTGYSTDVEVLEILGREHELPRKMLEYRTLEKLRGTYIDTLPALAHPETGRIHTSFNQAVTATGRLSSSNPNLQNIPVRTDFGRRVREGFVAANDKMKLISADYSQVELRILAHLSKDKGLAEAFSRDIDIHRDTAARIFNVMPEFVDSEMRRQAKAVNFGVIYGISAFGLARNIGISRKDAAKFIENYFELYPGVKSWIDDLLAEAVKDGYVTTILGRRRMVPRLRSRNETQRKAAERVAVNTPVQGSAADLIKLAMIRLDEKLEAYDARLLLQVHDELLVESPAAETDEVAEIVQKIMEEAIELDVPLKVDIGIGNNWAEIH